MSAINRKFEKETSALGKRIKDIRVSKNISQEKLSSICKIEKASISKLEAGHANPTLLTLFKIAIALKVSLADFFTAY